MILLLIPRMCISYILYIYDIHYISDVLLYHLTYLTHQRELIAIRTETLALTRPFVDFYYREVLDMQSRYMRALNVSTGVV